MTINQPITSHETDYDKSGLFFIETDLDGIIAHINDAFMKISGFPHNELIGQNLNIVNHPDMPQWAFDDMWKMVRGGHPWHGGEIIHRAAEEMMKIAGTVRQTSSSIEKLGEQSNQIFILCVEAPQVQFERCPCS